MIETNEQLEKEWKVLFPNVLYTGECLNMDIKEAEEVNNNILILFLFMGIVAAILAVSGLYTLVSLNIVKRMKEIAVRRVLGASIAHLVRKLNTHFIVILLIACLLGSGASYFLVGGMMDSIWAYHMDVDIIVFVTSTIVILIISVMTVGYKVFNAASENPALTLRNE